MNEVEFREHEERLKQPRLAHLFDDWQGALAFAHWLAERYGRRYRVVRRPRRGAEWWIVEPTEARGIYLGGVIGRAEFREVCS